MSGIPGKAMSGILAPSFAGGKPDSDSPNEIILKSEVWGPANKRSAPVELSHQITSTPLPKNRKRDRECYRTPGPGMSHLVKPTLITDYESIQKERRDSGIGNSFQNISGCSKSPNARPDNSNDHISSPLDNKSSSDEESFMKNPNLHDSSDLALDTFRLNISSNHSDGEAGYERMEASFGNTTRGSDLSMSSSIDDLLTMHKMAKAALVPSSPQQQTMISQSPKCKVLRPSACLSPDSPKRRRPMIRCMKFENSVNPYMPSPESLETIRSRVTAEDREQWVKRGKRMSLELGETQGRFDREFMRLSELGRGSYGVVFKALHRLDGTVYAVKAREDDPNSAGRVAKGPSPIREVWALRSLSGSRNIVQYFGSWYEKGYMYMQTEYCDGGSVSRAFRSDFSYSESEIRVMLRDVANGLHEMHSRGILHMDIKPENILEQHPKPAGIIFKICDLGHSSRIDWFDPQEGDRCYMAHELLDIPDNYPNSHMPYADVFSLGLTIHAVARGVPAPDSSNDSEQWHAYREDKVPHVERLSPVLNHLICSVLCKANATERCYAKDIVSLVNKINEEERT